jgi:DNA modification methylase
MNTGIKNVQGNGTFANLRVEYLPIETLKPYSQNARTHTKSQIRKIAESIRSFGFTNPVLIDGANTIVAGHGRVEAAKLLNLSEVPTIRLENLTPAQVRAYIIADNRLALDAGWDSEILKIELQNIIIEGQVDITLTGFEVPEIDLIINAEDEVDTADDLPEELPITVTRLGDIWNLGEHRVICGDARDEATFSALMQDHRAAVVFADPPYNVVIDGHVSGNGKVHHQEFAMASGEMNEVEFTSFLKQSLAQLAAWSIDGSVHFICMDFRHMGELLTAGKTAYDSLLNVCVWAKDNGGMGSFYRSQHEMIFVFKSGKAPYRNNIQLGRFGRNRTNVWRYPGANTLSRSGEENLLAIHPTAKPVALVADALLDCSARRDIVLDSFLGSGSTLLAAERVGRVCYGVEIEPRYVDLAIRRWQTLTGERAVLASTGMSFDELANKEAIHA